ncbi:uncharacterized protein LOC143230805 isoform X1 [Tachypleus tridentatus]|uniref:uncharacterized protein LOC143230805 isoform X1 n=1 Tax=Tachypleus tridentatus TaxID=6853 RepID=UPI003FD01A01
MYCLRQSCHRLIADRLCYQFYSLEEVHRQLKETDKQNLCRSSTLQLSTDLVPVTSRNYVPCTVKSKYLHGFFETFSCCLDGNFYPVHFGFVVFEMILSIFWALCGISLLYGYLKKNITFVIPWIVITSIVLLYDISTSVFYLNLLVSSLKKQAEDTSVETITNNIALVFLLLGFSRFGITFLCINVILFILVVTSTMEYWKIKDKDLLGSSAIEPDMRSQFQPDERYSHPKIPRRSIDNIRQSSSFAHILPHSSREPSTRDQDYTKRYYDNDDRSHSASRSDQERPDIHMLSRGRLEPETSIQPRISRPSRIC